MSVDQKMWTSGLIQERTYWQNEKALQNKSPLRKERNFPHRSCNCMKTVLTVLFNRVFVKRNISRVASSIEVAHLSITISKVRKDVLILKRLFTSKANDLTS